MFYLVEIEDIVAIPPRDFGKPLRKVVLERLREAYEGKIVEDLGHVVMVVDVEADPVG
ncbi:MAG TPA: DNA-directed RNA polymerase, partial [Nitrososphaeria archaeon]|nr:DNA-directed RNA polymerase [Nitrososphaeria archaeon]